MTLSPAAPSRSTAATTLVFNGATINGGTLDVLGVIDSTGTSLISSATIVNVDEIIVVIGTLTIDPTPFTHGGTIEVKDDSTLVLSAGTITDKTAPQRVSSRSMAIGPRRDTRSGRVHDQRRHAQNFRELDSTGTASSPA